MKILVSSDEPDTLERASEYLKHLPEPTSTTLLLSAKNQQEAEQQRPRLEALAEDLRQQIKTPVHLSLRQGDPMNQVLAEAAEDDFDLVVFGVHQQPRLGKMRPKIVARDLANRLDTPLLVVSPAWKKLERVLIWTSGEEPDETVIRRAAQLAANVQAEVTVLHVMSQIPLTAEADTRDLERDADSLMEHQTHEGQHLEKALSILEAAGVPAGKAEVKVRHGLTLDEIIEESNQGDFDLIVAGSTQIDEDESWSELRELLQEDIAVEILKKAARPVLIMRPHEVGEDFGL